jgi:hypothetical protein
LSLCILHVYLGAPYSFLMKFSYLTKKKKKKLPITFIMDLQTDGGSNYFGVE